MEGSLFRVLLYACALSAALGRHVFLPEPRNWTAAQLACREAHSDLSPVTSRRDAGRLYLASGGDLRRSWVGLHRDPPNMTAWRWSGGGLLGDYRPWGRYEPNNWGGAEVAVEALANGRWNDQAERRERPCYCISLLVVEERMRWEQALEHCRGGGRGDLLSMTTDTRLLLALADLRKTNTTTRSVWLGLRFLGGRWLWVNGNPMGFQGWSPAGGTQSAAASGQKPHCPVQDRTCGAMSQQGVWEARDCRDKLSFICD